MKSWRGLEKEQDAAETALCDVGELLSRPFHERAKELIIEISKLDGITIEYLLMGMGGWSFGRKALMIMAEGDIRELDDYMNGGPFGAGVSHSDEYAERWPELPKLAQELEDILMLLSDQHYLTLLNIDEEEMVKLLGNKAIKKKKSAKKA